MKNTTLLIVFAVIILISGALGWFIHPSCKNISQPSISLPQIDQTKAKAYEKKISLMQNRYDSLYRLYQLKPKVITITKKDSIFIASNPGKRDSILNDNCLSQLNEANQLIFNGDTLIKTLERHNKRLTIIDSTCMSSLSSVLIQKQTCDADNDKNQKKLKRWQGIGIGSIATLLIFILTKVL